jgi:Cft2 family RNA processing exonuclease
VDGMRTFQNQLQRFIKSKSHKNLNHNYRKLTQKIDYIFLSNNSFSHIGGLPLILKQENIKEAKVYATTPVAKLGFYIIADAFISKIETESLDSFTILSDSEISSAFLNIVEVKYKENIKLSHHMSEILLLPLSSGSSIGGCCWKILYKLNSLIYAPNFSIENKFICDPFPYESLKISNVFITDSMFSVSSKISLEKTVIESTFKKNMLECLNENKSIFIPSDSVNLSMELLIRLEKILDEFYLSKNREETLKAGYKVLVCGYSSYEIIENVKSLIEFMGSSIASQFYSYSDNPFNLQYVQCVKDFKEYNDIVKNAQNAQMKFIVLSSFESLDVGISYKIFPEIVTNPDFRVFIVSKSTKNSMLRDICRKIKEGESAFLYKEIRRVVEERPIPRNPLNTNTANIPQAIPLQIPNERPIESNLESLKIKDLSIKKKLFSKGPFPMFAYHPKRKITEYGLELNEKELKIMKLVSEEKNEAPESDFKAFLYTNNKSAESKKPDMRLKIKKQDLFSKAKYEEQIKTLPILAKFTFYNLFDHIDILSKEIIITEAKPKDYVFFLGSHLQNKMKAKALENMSSKIKRTLDIPVLCLSPFKTELLKFKDNLLHVKYDSTILNRLPSFCIKDYGFIYDLKNTFLKVKTHRKEIKEISLLDASEKNKEEVLNTYTMPKEKSDLDYFYTVSDLKLLNIKRELTKILNEEFFIFKGAIVNAGHDVKLYLVNNELVLEGKLSSIYLKVRNAVYSNFINFDEI